jgi:nitrous oxide reductase accessory protein NosL
MRNPLIIFAILLVVVSAQFLIAQNKSDILKPGFGSKIGECPICGMDVFENMLTRTDLIRGDTIKHACALGCASEMSRESHYDTILVHDCESMRMVPAMNAYFIFGSRLIPARAMMAAIPFASKHSAEQFQQLHGGTILVGKDALVTAAAIVQERMEAKKKTSDKKN